MAMSRVLPPVRGAAWGKPSPAVPSRVPIGRPDTKPLAYRLNPIPSASCPGLLTLAVATYVLLDFSSPYLPGVFSLDADQSMDGVVMSDHALGLKGSSPAV